MEIFGELQVKRAGRFNRTVERPIVFITAYGDRVEVPKGFITDLASIPRWLWSFLPPHDGQYARACVFHDYCYKMALGNKPWADRAFYEFCLFDGTPKWKAKLLYLGVKWRGRGNYY